MQVEAGDLDEIDENGLLYTISGDGVDDLPLEDRYFGINSVTGELIQLRVRIIL